MICELVDFRFNNTDDAGFNGHDGMCIGVGEDFEDALNDAISLILETLDLTNTKKSDIISLIESQSNRLGPGDSIDSAKRKTFYSVGIRYKC